jgi:hypothetical protein
MPPLRKRKKDRKKGMYSTLRVFTTVICMHIKNHG